MDNVDKIIEQVDKINKLNVIGEIDSVDQIDALVSTDLQKNWEKDLNDNWSISFLKDNKISVINKINESDKAERPGIKNLKHIWNILFLKMDKIDSVDKIIETEFGGLTEDDDKAEKIGNVTMCFLRRCNSCLILCVLKFVIILLIIKTIIELIK